MAEVNYLGYTNILNGFSVPQDFSSDSPKRKIKVVSN